MSENNQLVTLSHLYYYCILLSSFYIKLFFTFHFLWFPVQHALKLSKKQDFVNFADFLSIYVWKWVILRSRRIPCPLLVSSSIYYFLIGGFWKSISHFVRDSFILMWQKSVFVYEQSYDPFSLWVSSNEGNNLSS